MTNLFQNERTYNSQFNLVFQNEKYEQQYIQSQKEKKTKLALSILGFNVSYQLYKFIQMNQNSQSDIFLEIIQIISLLSNFASLYLYQKIDKQQHYKTFVWYSLFLGGIYFQVKNILQASNDHVQFSAMALVFHMSLTGFLQFDTFMQQIVPNLIYFAACIEQLYRKKWVQIDTFSRTNKVLENFIQEINAPIFLVQNNLDVILYTKKAYQLVYSILSNQKDNNTKFKSFLQIFPQEEDRNLVTKLVESAFEGKTVKLRVGLEQTILLSDQYDLVCSLTQWKGKKVVQIILEKIETKMEIVQKTVEKIIEKEVEKVVEKEKIIEVQVEVEKQVPQKLQQKNLSFNSQVFCHNIIVQQNIQSPPKHSKKPSQSSKQGSSYKKRQIQQQQVQSPGLSAIRSESSRNIEINLNVDQEIENKFDFLQNAMAKALEQILGKIKQCKGKKLNIIVSNNNKKAQLLTHNNTNNNVVKDSQEASEQLQQQHQQVNGLGVGGGTNSNNQLSTKVSPKSTLIRANSNNQQRIESIYQQFRTPGPQKRQFDRMMIMDQKKNILNNIGRKVQKQKPSSQQHIEQNNQECFSSNNSAVDQQHQKRYNGRSPLKKNSMCRLKDNNLDSSQQLSTPRDNNINQKNYIQENEGEDGNNGININNQAYDSENTNHNNTSDLLCNSNQKITNQQIHLLQTGMQHRPSIEIQQNSPTLENEQNQKSQFKNKYLDGVIQNQNQDSPGKNSKISSTTSILKGNFLSRMRQEDKVQQQGSIFANSPPQSPDINLNMQQQSDQLMPSSNRSIVENMKENITQQTTTQQNSTTNNDSLNNSQSNNINNINNQSFQDQQYIPQIGEYQDPPMIMCADDSGLTMMQFQGMKLEQYPNIKKVFKRNGLDAVNEYTKYLDENKLFHVIFMDDDMPKMGGLEAVQKIREIEKERNVKKTKIIGIVVDMDRIDRGEYMSKGMDDVIEKPLNKENVPFYLKQKEDEIISGVETKYEDVMQLQQEDGGIIQQQEKQKMPQIMTAQELKKKEEAQHKEKMQQQPQLEQDQNQTPAQKLAMLMQFEKNINQKQQVQNSQNEEIKQEEEQQQKQQQQNEDQNGAKSGNFQSPKLLLCVSESSMLIQQFSYFPIKNKAKRIFVKKGVQAMEKIRERYNENQQLFSFIIIDTNLKDISFQQLIKEIKEFQQQNNTQNINLIVISADLEELDQQSIIQLGANHILEKPLNNQIFNDLIAEDESIYQNLSIPNFQDNNQNKQGEFKLDQHLLICGSENSMLAMSFPNFPLEIKTKRIFTPKGEEILNQVKKQFEENKFLFTCIFIDEKLKDISGLECLQKIREYEQQNNLKPTYICYLTNNPEEIQDIQANQIIEKPLSKKSIIQSLDLAIQNINSN